MPKHSSKRCHRSRSRSHSPTTRRLAKRLAEMQRQLDNLNNRVPDKEISANVTPSAISPQDDWELSPDHSVVSDVVDPLNSDITPTPEHNPGAEENESTLGPNLLQLLGDEPINKAVEGPPINAAIVTRWTTILKHGLSENTKQDLLTKHLSPGNFPSLQVPRVNPELSEALSSQLLRRDQRLVHKQQLLTSSISAIAGTLSSLLEDKEGGTSQHIIQSLSNAAPVM